MRMQLITGRVSSHCWDGDNSIKAETVLKRENNMDENRVLKRKEDTNVQDLFFIKESTLSKPNTYVLFFPILIS